jgi:hypothetical protein
VLVHIPIRRWGRRPATPGVFKVDDLAGLLALLVVAKVEFELVVVRLVVVLDDDLGVNGQPALERKPSSGPIFLSRSNCSASAVSKVRPAGDLPKLKPQPSSSWSLPTQA